MNLYLRAFIAESNAIEGIYRKPTDAEIDEASRFLDLRTITVEELQTFVSVYEPRARLRDEIGFDVRVGNHYPPPGGPEIRARLSLLLSLPPVYCTPHDAWNRHREYEALHPFTDGNGRSGRMLWLWHMRGNAPLGFLHTFYYQTLNNLAS